MKTPHFDQDERTTPGGRWCRCLDSHDKRVWREVLLIWMAVLSIMDYRILNVPSNQVTAPLNAET